MSASTRTLRRALRPRLITRNADAKPSGKSHQEAGDSTKLLDRPRFAHQARVPPGGLDLLESSRPDADAPPRPTSAPRSCQPAAGRRRPNGGRPEAGGLSDPTLLPLRGLGTTPPGCFYPLRGDARGQGETRRRPRGALGATKSWRQRFGASSSVEQCAGSRSSIILMASVRMNSTTDTSAARRSAGERGLFSGQGRTRAAPKTSTPG